jgi:predicted peptidase
VTARAASGLAALAGVIACSGSEPPMTDSDNDPFAERSLTSDGRTWRYRVFAPARTDGHPPVILFLHGYGERGDDNQKQVEVGLGPHVRAHADSFPAVVVFPQAPPDGFWTDQTARAAIAALDAATAEFDGDPDRTYLTGLSRGGFGTWWVARNEPRRFAALAPICGGLTAPILLGDRTIEPFASDDDPFAATARALRHIPTWIFHGARDDVVPPEQSRRMAEALRAAGADVRYTEFPDANHNSWDPAYTTPELWEWLFAQRRR